VSEDDAKKTRNDVQKLHDRYIAFLDELFHKKQVEIMEV
jgi:ribosome recycling factor